MRRPIQTARPVVAVGYGRYSPDNGAKWEAKTTGAPMDELKHSRQVQIDAIGHFIQAHACEGWEAGPVFFDEHASGKNEARPNWQACMAHCEVVRRSGKQPVIVVHRLDRMSRGRLVVLIDELAAKGVRIASVLDSVDTGTAWGRAMLRVQDTFSALQRELTSERTTETLDANQRSGRAAGGKPPYGWAKVDKTLEPNFEEQAVLLLASRWQENTSFEEMAKRLNTIGVKTRDGDAWRGERLGRLYAKSLCGSRPALTPEHKTGVEALAQRLERRMQ